MKRIVLCFLAVFLTIPAFGRLNETYEQIVGRYGVPIKRYGTGDYAKNHLAYWFIFNNFNIVVEFVGGTSQREIITPANTAASISESDLNNLLQVNRGGKWRRWNTSKSTTPGIDWLSHQSNEVFAFVTFADYNNNGKGYSNVTIYTNKVDVKEAAAKSKVNGF